MKRLLKISFDLSLLSLIPVLSWFLLSIILDKNLINVFTLTYPFQFIYYILISLFSTGPNICKEKDKNKNAVMSGLLLGSIVSILIFSFILFNIDKYISFMNMDITIYKTFAIYSVIELFVCLEFAMILNKLYFEQKNTLANKYSLIFNLSKISLLVILSLFTKNQIIIITTTLTVISIFTLYVIFKNSDHFRYQLNLLKCIKYDSVELCNNIILFIVHLFGFSIALDFGEEYATALTFSTLITDTQWDTLEAIIPAANIDISKKQFNYKSHFHNAYKLLLILFSSSFLMFITLHKFYSLSYKILSIYLIIEAFNLAMYPTYRIKTCYLQLEWKSLPTTINKILSVIGRLIVTLIKSPFCTGLGLVFASIYQFITINFIFKKYYKIDKKGGIAQKNC